MPEAADILERIDRCLRELEAIKAAVTASMSVPPANGAGDADDLAADDLLDTTSAAARFNHPRNTLAKWAREEGIGVRQGGRWLISVPKLRRRLNGS